MMLVSLCIAADSVAMCSQKLQVYLFDEVFVMTRCCSHVDATSYQVYRQPISLTDLVIRDHADAVPTRKGSFRNAFSQLQTGKLFTCSRVPCIVLDFFCISSACYLLCILELFYN